MSPYSSKLLLPNNTPGPTFPLQSCFRPVSAKRYWLSLLALTTVMLTMGFYFQRSASIDVTLYYTLLRQLSDNDNCLIPEIDPYDPTIQKYLSKAEPLVCKKLQYELTYLRKGKIWLNEKEIEASGYRIDSLSCQFRCFDGKRGDDVTLEFGEWTLLINGSEPNCEFTEVQCKHKASYSPIAVSVYLNLHAQILPITTPPTPINSTPTPSVFLFVVDSVSHSNWKRNLPKTLNVLTSEYNSFVFKGFTKVGDNSFPNAIAFLTGKRVLTAGYENELPGDMSNDFFDDWPLIWKDFKEKNYTTLYAEDYPQFNLFKYLSNGFREKPTDHYFRPFWMHLYGSFLHRRSTHLCYGNQPCHKLQLNYLSDFIEKYSNGGGSSEDNGRPMFALSWLTELGHDWLNQVALGDDDFSSFFHSQHPHLKDSFVFVFSDHGHRFDPIRQSMIGRIEERMPFFSMHVPNWLMEEKPWLRETIAENSKQLTSFWDLYATLEDILRGNTSQSTRGLSLLRPLPSVRSCASAGIPEDFCVCQREQLVNVTNPNVINAAQQLIHHINQMLSIYSKECARLELQQIRNAQTFLPNIKMVLDPHASNGLLFDSMSRDLFSGPSSSQSITPTTPPSPISAPMGFYINYRVTIEANPSGALLEGTIQNHIHDNTYTVIGDINRINRYGNQSECIQSPVLRKYCYCI